MQRGASNVTMNAAGKDDVSEEVGARVLESIDMEISIWNAFIQAKADAIRRQMAGRIAPDISID